MGFLVYLSLFSSGFLWFIYGSKVYIASSSECVAMRLAGITILCLLVLACIRSNAVARSSFSTTFDHHHHHHHHDVGKRMKSSSSNGRVLEAANFSQYCKSKGHQFYDYFFHSNSKNTTSENKRVVPTGPNPLHNR